MKRRPPSRFYQAAHRIDGISALYQNLAHMAYGVLVKPEWRLKFLSVSESLYTLWDAGRPGIENAALHNE
jgi:hypothetical protein